MVFLRLLYKMESLRCGSLNKFKKYIVKCEDEMKLIKDLVVKEMNEDEVCFFDGEKGLYGK